MLSDLDSGFEDDALVLEDFHAAVHDLQLVELHVRNAVLEQATDAIGALEYGDMMADLIQLSSAGETSWSGADDGHFAVRANLWRFGHDPAFLKALVDDGGLDGFDGHSRLDDAERAGAFARSGTDAAGELGEVIRLVESVERFAPEAAVDEIVPLGNEVVDRASAGHAGEKFSGVAKWNAAIHAASALDFEFFLGHVLVEFVPIFDAAARRDVRGDLAVVFDKSSWFSHGLVPP